MFLCFPIGDTPNPRRTPWVNYAIIALNALVFVAVTIPAMLDSPVATNAEAQRYVDYLVEHFGYERQHPLMLPPMSYNDLVVFRWGFRAIDPSIVTLFTSMFLHAGPMHFLGNMWFLWIYGDNVEERLGRGRYVLAYLGTGAVATLAFAIASGGSPAPMVGASGAISGVMGFYFLLFPRNEVRFLFGIVFVYITQVFIPARWVLGFYLVFDNVFPMLLRAGGGGVAYGAHLGGFLAGLGVASWASARERARTPPEFRAPKSRHGARDPERDETPRRRFVATAQGDVRRLLADGAHERAAERFFDADEPDLREIDPDDALALAEWLAATGRPKSALSAYRRILRVHPTGPAASRAHLGAGRVQWRLLDRPVSAWQHLLDAIDTDANGSAATEARRLLEELDAEMRRRRG